MKIENRKAQETVEYLLLFAIVLSLLLIILGPTGSLRADYEFSIGRSINSIECFTNRILNGGGTCGDAPSEIPMKATAPPG